MCMGSELESASGGSEDAAWNDEVININLEASKKEELCDVTVIGTDGGRVPVVKFFLAAHSEVFEKMFYGQFREATSNEANVGFTSSVIGTIYDICRSGRIPAARMKKYGCDELMELITAAMYFEMSEKVLDICCSGIISHQNVYECQDLVELISTISNFQVKAAPLDRLCGMACSVLTENPSWACDLYNITSTSDAFNQKLYWHAFQVICRHQEESLLLEIDESSPDKGVVCLSPQKLSDLIIKMGRKVPEILKFRAIEHWVRANATGQTITAMADYDVSLDSKKSLGSDDDWNLARLKKELVAQKDLDRVLLLCEKKVVRTSQCVAKTKFELGRLTHRLTSNPTELLATVRDAEDPIHQSSLIDAIESEIKEMRDLTVKFDALEEELRSLKARKSTILSEGIASLALDLGEEEEETVTRDNNFVEDREIISTAKALMACCIDMSCMRSSDLLQYVQHSETLQAERGQLWHAIVEKTAKLEEMGCTAEDEYRSSGTTRVVVEGAGLDFVNGTYTQDGSCNGTPLYSKECKHEDEKRTIYILRPNEAVSVISVGLSGQENRDPLSEQWLYYSVPLQTSGEWSTCHGGCPAPNVTFIAAIDPSRVIFQRQELSLLPNTNNESPGSREVSAPLSLLEEQRPNTNESPDRRVVGCLSSEELRELITDVMTDFPEIVKFRVLEEWVRANKQHTNSRDNGNNNINGGGVASIANTLIDDIDLSCMRSSDLAQYVQNSELLRDSSRGRLWNLFVAKTVKLEEMGCIAEDENRSNRNKMRADNATGAAGSVESGNGTCDVSSSQDRATNRRCDNAEEDEDDIVHRKIFLWEYCGRELHISVGGKKANVTNLWNFLEIVDALPTAEPSLGQSFIRSVSPR